MDPESIHNLEEENSQLKAELERIQAREEGSLAWGFVNLISRYLIVGKGVASSTEELIRKYKRQPIAVHDKEIAAVTAAVVRRLSLVYLLGVALALAPAVFLAYQSYLLQKQTAMQSTQFEFLLEERGNRVVSAFSFEHTSTTKDLWESADDPDYRGKYFGTLITVGVRNQTLSPIVLDSFSMAFESTDEANSMKKIPELLRRRLDREYSDKVQTRFIVANPDGKYASNLKETLAPNQTVLLKFMVVEPDEFDGSILGSIAYQDRHSSILHTIDLGTSKPVVTP